MNSQVQIFSNLMLDDKEHKPHYKWMPGDLVAEIYKDFLNPPELIHRHLTPQQEANREPFFSTSHDLLCGRACAGTCGRSP